jgi:hypothetical protein
MERGTILKKILIHNYMPEGVVEESFDSASDYELVSAEDFMLPV